MSASCRGVKAPHLLDGLGCERLEERREERRVGAASGGHAPRGVGHQLRIEVAHALQSRRSDRREERRGAVAKALAMLASCGGAKARNFSTARAAIASNSAFAG